MENIRNSQHDNQPASRRPYEVPGLTVVTFKAERGFADSGEKFALRAAEIESTDNLESRSWASSW